MKLRKIVIWDGKSQAQLLAIDRETARAILHAIDDYLTDGSGDVKRLRPPRHELRLRVGDYRIFFLDYRPALDPCVGSQAQVRSIPLR